MAQTGLVVLGRTKSARIVVLLTLFTQATSCRIKFLLKNSSLELVRKHRHDLLFLFNDVYTLFLQEKKHIVFPAEAEYFYFSANFIFTKKKRFF